jgi:hypothetical protein
MLLLCLSFAGCPPPSETTTPSMEWNYAASPSSVWGISIDNTSDGGFIVGGGNSGYNMYALKLNAGGQKTWDKTYSNLTPDSNHTELWRYTAHGIRQMSNGGYVMLGAGHNYNDLMPERSYMLLKLDSAGNVTWSKAYAPVNPYASNNALTVNNVPAALTLTNDGSFVAFGSSYVGLYQLASIIQTDSAGTVAFNKVINDNARAYDQDIMDGQQTADGGYILTGYSDNGSPHGYLALLIKLNSAGNLEWSQTYQYAPDNHGAESYAVTQTADGGYIIGGELINDITKVATHGCWIAKVNSLGGVVWIHSYGHGNTIHFPQAFKETPQGDLLAVGDINGYLTLSKYSSTGALLWNYSMNNQVSGCGNDLALTDDGGCVIVSSGYTGGSTHVVKVAHVFTPVG